MANNGIKQATIAYKVRASDGAALDINGDPISESGRKQAIAVLMGTANPDPDLYEIEAQFISDGSIAGTPTTQLSPDCFPGYLTVSPANIILDPNNASATVTINSSGNWVMLESATAIATPSAISGPAGETEITLIRTAVIGQGRFAFKNEVSGQIVQIWVINVVDRDWILETGEWNMLGFWFDNGLWNF